jgi:glycosyltransferase involved in cell wall biosynthesis
MHVCIVFSTPFPPNEGIGNYVYNMSKKFIEKGHKITIITRGSWNKSQREVIDGINVIKAPYLPIYPFYIHLHGVFVNKIFKSIESQIDVVHIHTPLSPLVKTSLPIITIVHTPMLIDYNYVNITSIHSLLSKISARFVSYPLELKLLQASDVVTTVSRSIAQELKEYHFDPDEVVVIGNGVDEKFFVPAQNTIDDDKYIMYAGHIDREKGLFDLVDCGEYICNQRSDISFILAGRGRDLDKLKKKVRKLGLQDKFIFLGQVGKDQLVQLYQNATLFAFPSYHEGLPTVLLEAMSCGLPVIATDVRGNRDLISSGKNGILVPSRSPKEIADAILRLLDDEKMRRKLGKNARETIEEQYTWDEISNRMVKCYESLVK